MIDVAEPGYPTVDEWLWLENIHASDALKWAADQSAATLATVESAEFGELTARLLEVIDSDARIPIISKRGNHYYNFWRDKSHPRGLWRRTTLASYLSETTEWEVLLDVDELGRSENTEWVFAGAKLLPNDHGRALISLSPDGGDAAAVREFDLASKTFVTDGFALPTAKSIVSWVSRDSIYVGTDTGAGSLTSSGYPRTVRLWQRGTSLATAPVMHEVGLSDLEVVAAHIHTPGFERDLVIEVLDFYRSRTFVMVNGAKVHLEVPDDSDVSIRRNWLLVHPRSPWRAGESDYDSGSLLVIDLDQFLSGDRAFTVLFCPDSQTALAGWDWTQSHIVLTLLVDVASQLCFLTPDDGWSRHTIDGLPELATLRVADTDADHSEEIWVHATGFATPAMVLVGGLPGRVAASPVTAAEAFTVAKAVTAAEAFTVAKAVTAAEAFTVAKAAPSFFDENLFEVAQHWVSSADSTRVPYFQVSRRGLTLDGTNPTLMSGYGGFQTSRLAEYNGLVGRGWLECGGVYVVANIRGGGEFGPGWHTAALKHNRPRAYEDFAAVARDLVRRGVTTASRLGAEGRSNGGLLVGNMLTSYPELFGAIVCGVPLLDMQRYTKLSAGASWIAEYGDPDVAEEWEYLRTFSPYHLLRPGVDYPPVLLYAATSDDRVGPVQARKMAARMQALGVPDVLYFENSDGGHGGAVDNTHTARLAALTYQFLMKRLSL